MEEGGGGGGVFFFQAEDGIRDIGVTGVQTCALPISWSRCLSLTSVMLSGRESLTPPGQDTNPLQVSSQQILVLIYLLWKVGKLS